MQNIQIPRPVIRTDWWVLLTLMFTSAMPLFAQSTRSGSRARIQSTTVNVHLVTTQLQSALKSQEWAGVFRRIGYPVRIRRAASDKLEVTEKLLGRSRTVTAIGLLDRSGTVEFARGRKFKVTDEIPLKKWLDHLKMYGAQGAPDGQPLWGLNSQQFAKVYNSLSVEFKDEVGEQDLQLALIKLEPAAGPSLRMTPEAKDWLKLQPAPVLARQEVKGLSKGSALAIVLKDYRLGLYPTRTPSGLVELLVKPLSTNEKAWPLGWDLKLSRTRTAPLLFKLFPVNLKDMAITELMGIVADKTKVPVFFDHDAISSAEIDLAELTVTIPERKSTLFRAVQTATARNHLIQQLLIDELGQPFLYVTTSAAARRAKEKKIDTPTVKPAISN
jgi:hypothetical protein